METRWEGGLLQHADNFKLSLFVFMYSYTMVCMKETEEINLSKGAVDLLQSWVQMDVLWMCTVLWRCDCDCGDVCEVFLVLLLAWVDQEC